MALNLDPRVDLGTESVVRGDPFSWTVTVQADDVSGNPQPVDLTVFGDVWAAQARTGPDATPAYDFDVDVSDAATGVLVLSLTAVQTAAMDSAAWKFDVQVSDGAVTPQTILKGTVDVVRDYTR